MKTWSSIYTRSFLIIKVTVQGKGKKHLDEGLGTCFGTRDSSTACKMQIFHLLYFHSFDSLANQVINNSCDKKKVINNRCTWCTSCFDWINFTHSKIKWLHSHLLQDILVSAKTIGRYWNFPLHDFLDCCDETDNFLIKSFTLQIPNY